MGSYGGLMGFNVIYPLVKIQKTMQNQHVWWVNQLYKWQCSIANCWFTRGYQNLWFILLVLNAGNGWERENGTMINSYYGSFPHSLLSTSKSLIFTKRGFPSMGASKLYSNSWLVFRENPSKKMDDNCGYTTTKNTSVKMDVPSGTHRDRDIQP